MSEVNLTVDESKVAVLRGGWQPIETAPKDGESILAYKPDESRSGDWMTAVYWGEWPGRGECWIAVAGHAVEPTHWMPLPRPPNG